MSSSATMLSPDELARASAAAMWEEDRSSQGLGIEMLDIGAGRAKLTMIVQSHMVNGHSMTHGGYVFTLADSAFAFACNSHNERAVAAHCSISFIQPSKLGDRLVAAAREVSRSGRSGIYDVQVTVNNVTIAEFRGHSRTIGGLLVPQDGSGSR